MNASEREEIRQLIQKDYAIKLTALKADDPEFERRIDDRCRKVAIGQLGIAAELKKKEELERSMATLQQKIEDIETSIERKLPFEEKTIRRSCPTRKDICTAINDIANRIRPSESAKDSAGKKALAIDDERNFRLKRLAACSTREDVAAAGILS